MDQVKIGKFISECRKKNNLTQMQLAEKLNITDRAISKWETGKAMPDSGIMLDLCKELKITVNELLSGEMIDMKNYDKKTEELLLEMHKQKEQSDRRLLTIEIVMGVITLVLYIALVMGVGFLPIKESTQVMIIMLATLLIVIMAFVALKIEQVAGYYECRKCHHKYVPTYSSVLWAMHIGRTRYMKCPDCNKRSWQKKVVTKEQIKFKINLKYD